ncbi:MAG TPA: response regulator, partial [Geobacteraceae bacterium]
REVIEARDGREGLDMARAQLPDLIISDALMPRMDGFEFLREVKNDEALKEIPFVFHSSVYTGSRDEDLASSLGAEAFISKPKEPEEFWAEIAAVMQRLAAGASKPPPSEMKEREREYLREHTEVVAAKLEQKVKELEEALSRASEAEAALRKFSLAVEQSPLSIVITDSSGTIEFVNPKFTQMTGYEPAEVVGRNTRILKSGETPPETYENLWSTITSGNVWEGEFHNRKKTGELFWEAATISPLKNSEGIITHFIALKEDITAQKKLEQQLRHAQKMEAVGTLAGGVAHDFNNILTAIIGFGSLLDMKMAEGDPLRPHVTQLLAAADRATNLTRSLLAFGRSQATETKRMDLNEIVTGMERMLRRILREDIELRIHLCQEDLPVRVDVGQIEQVLMNLTANARDAICGVGAITVATGVTELDEEFRRIHGYGEPGSYALITFADSGSGMDEKTRLRIFEPFFTTKDVGKGTGLGLSICYGIVKQHGGYINCYSEPGMGTTFRIYLPLTPESAAQKKALVEVLPRGGTETILLAEDDPTVRSLTTSMLAEFGYTVIEAQDGEEAVARFSEHSTAINLCLFDAIMPKKSGWEAYGEIRKMCPDAKVLFVSGYQAEQTSQVTGGADFIAKPVSPRVLLGKVREVLDR